jgi:hypothetical protein
LLLLLLPDMSVLDVVDVVPDEVDGVDGVVFTAVFDDVLAVVLG